VVKGKAAQTKGSSGDKPPDREPECRTRTGQGRHRRLACAGDGNEWMLARPVLCSASLLFYSTVCLAGFTILPAGGCRQNRSYERAARNEAPLCTSARGSWSHAATWRSDSSGRGRTGRVAELQIDLEEYALC
jgi:hypothetical protein